MNEDFSLMGYELERATADRAVELDDLCERRAFKRYQAVGYKWVPTRQLFEDHILSQLDKNGEFRSKILALSCAAVAQSIFSIVLLIMLLKR